MSCVSPGPAARRDPVQGPPRQARRAAAVRPDLRRHRARHPRPRQRHPGRGPAPVATSRPPGQPPVVKAFRTAGLAFPWRHLKGPREDETDWQPCASPPCSSAARDPLASTFASRQPRGAEPGGNEPASQCPARMDLLRSRRHPGYITLGQWEANIARLAANAAAHGRDRARPPREGPALLQGIIICGRCSRRSAMRYHARGGEDLPTYLCQRDGIGNARPICAAIPSHTLDEHIGQLLIAALSPLAVEAAFQVSAELPRRAAEADRCAPPTSSAPATTPTSPPAPRRRPRQRLVAGTLEADWNTALRALTEARPPTTRPASSTTAPSHPLRRTGSASSSPTCPASGTTPPPDARTQAPANE